jgi:predicted MPP superfamily phosphohydrolase
MRSITHVFVFLGLLAIILSLSHFYIFSRLNSYLHFSFGQKRFAAFLLGGFIILILLSLPLSRVLPREIGSIVAWAIFPWMGIVLLLLVALVITDALWLLTNLLPIASVQDPVRRVFLQRAFGFAALGATGAATSYSLYNGLRPVSVKPLTVTLKKLPPSMDGFRIVQVTDLHIGPMINGIWLREVVERVNALKPDLIAITGDLVDGSVEELNTQTASIAELKAPLGVYFITGNHEYYSGVEEWCAHLARLGLRVMRNERVIIKADNGVDSFDLAGVDDWGSRNFPGEGPNLPKALAGRGPDKALILLAHQPAAIHEAAAHSVDLQLSGHTHGGQMWPFKYIVYLQQPYVEGLHQHPESETQIYVSPGTGYWGPPMRLGTAAEITHITLRSAG